MRNGVRLIFVYVFLTYQIYVIAHIICNHTVLKYMLRA
jgi:hypothetical protein